MTVWVTVWVTVSAIVWVTVCRTVCQIVCRTVWEIAWEIAQAEWATGIDAREIGPGNQRTLGDDRIVAEVALAALLLAALHRHQDGAPLPEEALRPDLPLPGATSDLRGLDHPHPLGGNLRSGEGLGHHLTTETDFAGIDHR